MIFFDTIFRVGTFSDKVIKSEVEDGWNMMAISFLQMNFWLVL